MHDRSTAPWWTPDFPDMLAKREPIPGPERWQTSYVRYRRSADAQLAPQGWDLQACRHSYEAVAQAQQADFLPDTHILFDHAMAPRAITLTIVEAPSEFAVPVKQDRRLAPNFKVRVEVKYSGAVSLPLTLRAFLLSQQDKDNVLAWQPDDGSDDKAVQHPSTTDLKGTTSVTHHFEGGMGGRGRVQGNNSNRTSGVLIHGTQAEMPLGALDMRRVETRLQAAEAALTLGTNLFSSTHGMPARTLGGGGPISVDSLLAEAYPSLASLHGQQQAHMGLDLHGHHAYHHGLQLPHGGLGVGGGNTGMLLSLFSEQQQQLQHQQQQQHGGHVAPKLSLPPGRSSNNGYHGPQQAAASLLYGAGSGNGHANNNNNNSGLPESALLLNQRSHQQQHTSSSSWHQLNAGGGGQHQDQLGQRSSATSSVAQPAGMQQLQQQQQEGDAELHTISQDYEFTNLELVKPTRMNKVYMAFAAQILDLDVVYVVFSIPTIGICRAEQREKACQKLGVDYRLLASHFEHIGPHHHLPFQPRPSASSTAGHHGNGGNNGGNNGHGLDAGGGGGQGLLMSGMIAGMLGASNGIGNGGGYEAVGRKRENYAKDDVDVRYGGGGMMMGGGNDLLGVHGAALGGHSLGAAAYGSLGLGLGGGGADDVSMGHARSRLAMREIVLDEYESTGLTRRLGQLDIEALLSQAGFPAEHANVDHCTISALQWEEFLTQFRAVLDLLRQIATVWNLEDPCCVISGFDMDRQGTVAALAAEPAGTFVCRFSMSQPGCLVLSVKAAPGHPKADPNGLIHAIIRVDDLAERRVDTWIRDYAGATHVLDVYRQKRVDKRKVFASNYTRLRGLEMEPSPALGPMEPEQVM